MSSHEREKFTELADWMRENGVSIRDLAADIGVDKTKLWRLLHGRSVVLDVTLIEAIARRTNRRVGYKEFCAFAVRLGLTLPEEAA
jgi:transcriptional regulator with XRE-family HTH domain